MKELSRDTTAYNIGWDAALYGLPFYQDSTDEMGVGWHAGREKYPNPRKSNRFIRKWIQLRAGAYRRGKYFSESVTPNYLKMINMGICPVTIREFTYASGTGDDWSVDRVDNDRGYERQNLVSMSTKANSAKSSLSYEEIADLVEHQDHVAQLDCAETKKLWATVSTFFRADRDNILNRNNFYQGFLVAPDTPLNGIMSLQISLSISFNNKNAIPGYQSMLLSRSRASGNLPLAKKMIKRLCKFRARHPQFVYLLFLEWGNPVNVSLFHDLDSPVCFSACS